MRLLWFLQTILQYSKQIDWVELSWAAQPDDGSKIQVGNMFVGWMFARHSSQVQHSTASIFARYILFRHPPVNSRLATQVFSTSWWGLSLSPSPLPPQALSASHSICALSARGRRRSRRYCVAHLLFAECWRDPYHFGVDTPLIYL